MLSRPPFATVTSYQMKTVPITNKFIVNKSLALAQKRDSVISRPVSYCSCSQRPNHRGGRLTRHRFECGQRWSRKETRRAGNTL